MADDEDRIGQAPGRLEAVHHEAGEEWRPCPACGKVDVRASDTVLDDKPVDDVDPPPAQASPAGPPPRPAAESLGQAGASFGQAGAIEMVFRAKLRRLEFETKQGRLVEAEAARRRLPRRCAVSAMASEAPAPNRSAGRA